jgi:hypothetical protein
MPLDGGQQCFRSRVPRGFSLWCREGELNPQGTKYRRILSPLRLPVPPSRLFVEVLDLEIDISPHSFVARTRERETVQWSARIRRSAQVTAHALCNPSLQNAAWRDHESNLRKILSPFQCHDTCGPSLREVGRKTCRRLQSPALIAGPLIVQLPSLANRSIYRPGNLRAWKQMAARRRACHIMLGQRSSITLHLCSCESKFVSS